jgi:hypothetical protein
MSSYWSALFMCCCMLSGRTDRESTAKKPGSAAAAIPGIVGSVVTGLVEKVQGVGGVVDVVDALAHSNQAEQRTGTRRGATAVE